MKCPICGASYFLGLNEKDYALDYALYKSHHLGVYS
jgi:hypothetical protein